jgi:hypothetical protein
MDTITTYYYKCVECKAVSEEARETGDKYTCAWCRECGGISLRCDQVKKELTYEYEPSL